MKINQIYKIKEGHEGNCFNYCDAGASFIKFTKLINDKLGTTLQYDILDSDKQYITWCEMCFTEDDLELEEEVKEKSLEDLEVGDEVMDKNNRRYKVIKMDITLEQQQGENTLVYDYTLNELKERKFKVYIPD